MNSRLLFFILLTAAHSVECFILIGVFRFQLESQAEWIALLIEKVMILPRSECVFGFRRSGLAQRKAYINGEIIACSIWAVLL